MNFAIIRKFIITLTLNFFLSSLQNTTSIPTYEQIHNEALELAQFFTETQRDLHKIPEISFREFKTSNYIKQFLTNLNIPYTDGWGVNDFGSDKGGTGIVAEIGTHQSPCIALRADIDALPIQELVESEHKSTHPGAMHACGHDVHTAMLLGAAKLLSKYRDQIEGTIRLIFQPAEETDAGAFILEKEGVLTQYPPVERIFGLHVDPKVPTGTIISYPGIFWGGQSGFIVTITGKGGHAATHHLTIDPIAAGMAFIRSLYDLSARELYFDPEFAGAISVTYIKTSNRKSNIIPESITIGGSTRSITPETLFMLRKRIFEIGEKIAASYKCSIEFWPERREVYVPTLYNDPELFKFYEKVVSEGARNNKLVTTEPEFTSEDFAFFSEKVPSIFSLIGIGSGSEIPGHPPTDYGLHNAKFFIDERVLPIGASIHAHLALQNIVDLNSNTAKPESNKVHDEL